MERYVMLPVPDWNHPGGVQEVPTPFPADPVEAFVGWLRRNRQWRNDATVIQQQAIRFLKRLEQVGPLSQQPTGLIAVTPTVSTTPEPVHGIPCPECGQRFRALAGLARHKQAKHTAVVTIDTEAEA